MTPAKKSVPAKAPAPKKAAPAKAAVAKSPAKTTGRAEPKKPEPKQAAAPAKKVPAAAKAAAKTPVSKASAPKPPAAKAPAKSPFPAKFLQQQEKALLEERATYFDQFTSLKAEADALVADYEPGDVQFDEESGEGDTISMERERDLQLSAQARQMVDEIDLALSKIKDGSYGICEASGDAIPKERLEAIPWARVRVEYKTGGLASRR